jgi:hypothetical protein
MSATKISAASAEATSSVASPTVTPPAVPRISRRRAEPGGPDNLVIGEPSGGLAVVIPGHLKQKVHHRHLGRIRTTVMPEMPDSDYRCRGPNRRDGSPEHSHVPDDHGQHQVGAVTIEPSPKTTQSHPGA